MVPLSELGSSIVSIPAVSAWKAAFISKIGLCPIQAANLLSGWFAGVGWHRHWC